MRSTSCSDDESLRQCSVGCSRVYRGVLLAMQIIRGESSGLTLPILYQFPWEETLQILEIRLVAQFCTPPRTKDVLDYTHTRDLGLSMRPSPFHANQMDLRKMAGSSDCHTSLVLGD